MSEKGWKIDFVMLPLPQFKHWEVVKMNPSYLFIKLCFQYSLSFSSSFFKNLTMKYLEIKLLKIATWEYPRGICLWYFLPDWWRTVQFVYFHLFDLSCFDRFLSSNRLENPAVNLHQFGSILVTTALIVHLLSLKESINWKKPID